MKHLMRDIDKLHRAYGHPVREKPLSSDDINDLRSDDALTTEAKAQLQQRLLMRLRLVTEEFFELLHGALGDGARGVSIAKDQLEMALESWNADYDYNTLETADALTDLMVVIVGMSLELGMPLDRLWDEVQRSNMAKVGEDGRVRRREDGKVLKPDGWTPPDIPETLKQPSRAWDCPEEQLLVDAGIPLVPGQDPFDTLLDAYHRLDGSWRASSFAASLVASAALDAPREEAMEDLASSISRAVVDHLNSRAKRSDK